MKEFETIIIGGGPAGSSCAWELRRRGRDCAILERQALPKFKLCAGWITPQVLQDLEFAPREYPHGIVTLRRMRVYLGLSPFSLGFPTLQYSIRRVEFDNWLLSRCKAPVYHHAVRSITADGAGYVIDDAFRCRFLVGAGGTNCPVKRSFFPPDKGQLILTQEIEFEAKAKEDACVLFYPFAGLAGYGWHVPKANALNIGFGGVASQFRGNIKSYWSRFAQNLVRRGLLEREPPEPFSHPYYVGDRQKNVRNGNAFIVGDAAGLATMDLGEGIGPAVRSGLAAARQIAGAGSYAAAEIEERSMNGWPGRLLSRFVCAC